MSILSDLEPADVFRYFEQLCAVPHGSGNTGRISNLCADFARELGLNYHQDSANNLVIWKPASPSYEGAQPLILQGHMDMVCAKTEGCPKNMAEEGLDLMTDGLWVWARDTTLGGDNGIAVAMILAILADQDLPHPPIEAVLTTDEEIGMGGAFALDCSDLRGRKLLNLDSEEEGVFTVSCAGGVRLDCLLSGALEDADGLAGYAITLEGLKGGHSGADIDKGRGSANQLMGRVLYSAMERIPGLCLADIRGGQFDNVICSTNRALIAVPRERGEQLQTFLVEFSRVLKEEYAVSDAGLTLSCRQEAVPRAMNAQATEQLLSALLAMPQGVQAMSMDFPGLVQTSLNLGVMGVEEDGLHLTFSVRSNAASQKEMLVQRVRAIVKCAGGTVTERNSYPSWPFARQSPLRDIAAEAYREISGRDAVITATHGGLECGLFMEKIPGLDTLSIGPELRDVHSVRERLSVPSTQRTYRLVREILRRSR